MADDHTPSPQLEPREPTVEDLRDLCRELHPGEPQQYQVIRVADEIVVDLMCSSGGIEYAEAAQDVTVVEVQGVPIPFASPRLLWRMKAVTHREKDSADLVFLGHWFAERGEKPPDVP